MDPSGGSVPIGQNLTGRIEPGMNKKNLDRIYEKQICSHFLNNHLISFTVLLKMHFSVRTLFQNERLLNISNMVFSGMKTQFYT